MRPDRVDEFAMERFLAREDPALFTKEQIAWDRRQVGLFKVETIAERFWALSPKCYVCAGTRGTDAEHVLKLSAKGISRTQNKLTWKSFYNVLCTQQELVGVSRTLRRPLNRQFVCRVDGPKRCLAYEFFKRKLAPDGIKTFPLDL